MSLRRVEGLPGAPWDRPLAGMLDRITVHSELLAQNPLGDPARRPLYVYRSPGAVAGGRRRFPSIYVIQGYSGQVDMWPGRSAFEPTIIERLDAMFAAGDCPDAVIVFVDAWTSLGGSQFLNSSSTGPYLDYLCDEIVPFVDERYPALPGAEHRGIAGKSSGGYGAMVVPMLRPDVFGGLASHAGDALFECCYLRDFPVIARRLRDDFGGSYEELLRRRTEEPAFDWGRYGEALSMYAYACAYTPDPARPGKPLLPFDVRTGRLVDEVWQRWLELDPVRMAESHVDALRGMRRIYLDAGRHDEFFLDVGAQAFANELTRLRIDHTLELFDGKHGGIAYRYPGAIRELVLALQ
ncbi:MAG TPA: alpha/beta hydrolase-fold protein [Solirubrobacteraceae bacterium]|nr:alpha/beta hydrolase-fold protein [Solirubrobacteraceae bacterium]